MLVGRGIRICNTESAVFFKESFKNSPIYLADCHPCLLVRYCQNFRSRIILNNLNYTGCMSPHLQKLCFYYKRFSSLLQIRNNNLKSKLNRDILLTMFDRKKRIMCRKRSCGFFVLSQQMLSVSSPYLGGSGSHPTGHSLTFAEPNLSMHEKLLWKYVNNSN